MIPICYSTSSQRPHRCFLSAPNGISICSVVLQGSHLLVTNRHTCTNRPLYRYSYSSRLHLMLRIAMRPNNSVNNYNKVKTLPIFVLVSHTRSTGQTDRRADGRSAMRKAASRVDGSHCSLKVVPTSSYCAGHKSVNRNRQQSAYDMTRCSR